MKRGAFTWNKYNTFSHINLFSEETISFSVHFMSCLLIGSGTEFHFGATCLEHFSEIC